MLLPHIAVLPHRSLTAAVTPYVCKDLDASCEVNATAETASKSAPTAAAAERTPQVGSPFSPVPFFRRPAGASGKAYCSAWMFFFVHE